ncbi:hypothetical protein FQA39_LY12173 [Lamprigera yunnana]|nr:hypothetical protein FQA39_LY12173 [Lamprigera yunnana]
MEQDIVYVCNVCNFSSANHTVVEEHMQSHSFTSDFSALQGVSARFVEHNVHVVNYNNKAPEPASLQSAEKIWCKGNVLILIDAYKQHEAQFATTIKKVVWQKIANVLSEKANVTITTQQCDTKWKGAPESNLAVHRQCRKESTVIEQTVTAIHKNLRSQITELLFAENVFLLGSKALDSELLEESSRDAVAFYRESVEVTIAEAVAICLKTSKQGGSVMVESSTSVPETGILITGTTMESSNISSEVAINDIIALEDNSDEIQPQQEAEAVVTFQRGVQQVKH